MRKRAIAASSFLLPVGIFAQTICIDPGHPSEVGRGTQGKKITEIKAVWLVAQGLEKLLVAKGYTVVMTKATENQFVKNRDRSAIANKAKSDLMVRLHCDSQSGSGFAVYVPMKQGKINGKVGPSKEVIESSKKIGRIFHDELKEKLKGKLKDNGFLSDTFTAVGGKYGALIGSIYSEVPVALVELCRLSSAKDEQFIASKDGQDFYAGALAAAIEKAVPVKSK